MRALYPHVLKWVDRVQSLRHPDSRVFEASVVLRWKFNRYDISTLCVMFVAVIIGCVLDNSGLH